MAKKYYWLKLKDNFFNQPKIKKLRSIPGGAEYTVIYLKMQLLSLKSEGVLYFEGIEDNFAEELALILDENYESIEVTLNFLKRHELIEEYEKDEYSLIETISSIGKECDSAPRVRKYRKKEKTLQCNGDVTNCNTEIEIEIEKEIDIEIKKEIKVPYQEIINLYNEICLRLPRVMKCTENRKKSIKARFKEYEEDVEVFKTLFHKANESDFLCGINDRGWKGDFDWLMNQQNMAKVLEDRYVNKQVHESTQEKASFDYQARQEELKEMYPTIARVDGFHTFEWDGGDKDE